MWKNAVACARDRGVMARTLGLDAISADRRRLVQAVEKRDGFMAIV